MSMLGIKRDIRGKVLNHKDRGVTDAVYNSYDYLEEKKEALDKWEAKILKLTE